MCSKCEKRITGRTSYNYHKTKGCKKDTKLKREAKQHPCGLCLMSFATGKALKRHIKRMHDHRHTKSKTLEPSKRASTSSATGQENLLNHQEPLTAAENYEVEQVANALLRIQQTMTL